MTRIYCLNLSRMLCKFMLAFAQIDFLSFLTEISLSCSSIRTFSLCVVFAKMKEFFFFTFLFSTNIFALLRTYLILNYFGTSFSFFYLLIYFDKFDACENLKRKSFICKMREMKIKKKSKKISFSLS